MLDNVLQRQKLVSVGEKSVSDFEHFHTTHPRPIQTPFWGIGVWIFVRLSTSFCTLQPDCTPWYHSPESCTVQKRKRHRQSFDYQCLSLISGNHVPVSSGAGGNWPPSPYLIDNLYFSKYS